MVENAVQMKSYAFALETIKLAQELAVAREFVVSRQMLRAGTSIGANIEEAQAAQSRRDFLSKMAIASKEARECNYWLRLIRDSNLVAAHRVQSLLDESEELIRLLSAITKTAARNA